MIKDKVNISIKFKEHEDIELETNHILSLLQHAAKDATPRSDLQRTANNLPYEIKKLRSSQKEQPGKSGKELTHQTTEENITEQATVLNQNSQKCGENPLKKKNL
jgi:uncharacterized membrane protein YcaP (DUF421 family)